MMLGLVYFEVYARFRGRGNLCYLIFSLLLILPRVCAKFDQFLPERSHFDSKRPENFVRIATFPSATFGAIFAFHCPLFFTKNNNLEWKSSRFAIRNVLKTVTMTSA